MNHWREMKRMKCLCFFLRVSLLFLFCRHGLFILYFLNQDAGPDGRCSWDHCSHSRGERSYTSCKLIDGSWLVLTHLLLPALGFYIQFTPSHSSCAAWRDGLWPGTCPGSVLRLQQERAAGRQLPLGSHARVRQRWRARRATTMRRNCSQSLHHAKAVACRAEIGKRFGICVVCPLPLHFCLALLFST